MEILRTCSHFFGLPGCPLCFSWVEWHLKLPTSKREICSGSFQVQPRAPTEHLSRGSGNGLEKNRMMVANKSQNCLTPQNSFFQYCQQHGMKGAPLWCWHGTHCPPGPEHDWTGKVFSPPYTEMEWLFFFVFGGAGTWQKQQCSLNLWWKNVKENLRKSKVKIHLNCNMCG